MTNFHQNDKLTYLTVIGKTDYLGKINVNIDFIYKTKKIENFSTQILTKHVFLPFTLNLFGIIPSVETPIIQQFHLDSLFYKGQAKLLKFGSKKSDFMEFKIISVKKQEHS